MGIYTKFIFDATLRKDIPAEIREYIRHRLTRPGEGAASTEAVPFDAHPFFDTPSWYLILTWHNVNGNGFKAHCEETDLGLRIHIDTEFKNYDNEIRWFLLWIAPMVDTTQPCTKFIEVEDSDADEEDCIPLILKIQEKITLNSGRLSLTDLNILEGV